MDSQRGVCETDFAFGSAGVFAEVPCPSENRVGVCDQTDADNNIHYYSTGGNPYDATTAEADCNGVFTAN